MSKLSLYLDTNDTGVFINANRLTTAQNLQLLFKSMEGGARLKNTSLVAGVTPVAATGTVTISSGSGSIAAVINGVTISITWATSDTNSAALLAAAINASSNALVQNLVTATSALGVCTVTAGVKYGVAGNAFTLAATGTGATASGARLTSGSNGTVTTFAY